MILTAGAQHSFKTYIVSLKYAPGLAKEFLLLGRNLERHGWDVTYLVSQEYAWLMKPAPKRVHYLTRSGSTRQIMKDLGKNSIRYARWLTRLFSDSPPKFLCLYNPHPLNFVVARSAQRVYPTGIRSVYLHEPHKPDKSSFGTSGVLYFYLAEFLQTLSLIWSTCVILPSSYAYNLFGERYPAYHGSVHLAPILLPEFEQSSSQLRKYVSLVGTINRSRGLDTFISLINHMATTGGNLQFKIVTRSEIARSLELLATEALSLVDVVNKPQISDQEIAETVAQSIALFLPHRQVTQSGNIPVAFRLATPVIARDLPGFAQHVRHKHNGYLVPYDATPDQIREAISYVSDNFDRLSRNARRSFDEKFSERNWDRYYEWLIRDRVGNLQPDF